MEHIDIICSLDNKLNILYICSIEILSNFKELTEKLSRQQADIEFMHSLQKREEELKRREEELEARKRSENWIILNVKKNIQKILKKIKSDPQGQVPIL